MSTLPQILWFKTEIHYGDCNTSQFLESLLEQNLNWQTGGLS